MTVCSATHFPRLSWQLYDSVPAEPHSHVLGGAVIGAAGAGAPLVAAGSTGGTAALPLQQVDVPLLGTPQRVVTELWSSSAPCTGGEAHGIEYRSDGSVLYGVVRLEHAAEDLLAVTEDAYKRLFLLLQEQGYAHLWRVWNYLPGINVETAGLERYRQFNVGRQNAFMAHQQVLQGCVPAACALGAGQLSLAFMAGRVAPYYLENPRQVSAYDYPPEYGPRSPTFSRAVLLPLGSQEILFISGTASIVGHATVHHGDVVAQTEETLRNISTLLQQAERVGQAGTYTLADLGCRVYIRQPQDLEPVRAVLRQWGIGDTAVLYVQADVCRSDLLVEIEATALRDVPASPAATVHAD